MKYYNIPIFVPHEGCPFDCIFCNQRKITGMDTGVTASDVSNIIEEHLKTFRDGDKYVEAAFFGGSFTGISPKKQEELLSAAYRYKKEGKINGIRLSTRPDYINEEILDRLVRYGVTAVELGVQSMDKEVLLKAARGHSPEAVTEAVRLIGAYPLRLGLQMMTGLPGDTAEKSIETAKKIIALKPDFVRIYPTLVLSDTALLRLYERGEYKPQELFEAVGLVKKLLLMFKENNIEVIRVGLCTTEEISEGGAVAAGPYHSAFRELCEGEIYYDEMLRLLEENPRIRVFSVNPKEISKAVGNRKRNIHRIKEKYGFTPRFVQDTAINPWELKARKE